MILIFVTFLYVLFPWPFGEYIVITTPQSAQAQAVEKESKEGRQRIQFAQQADCKKRHWLCIKANTYLTAETWGYRS